MFRRAVEGSERKIRFHWQTLSRQSHSAREADGPGADYPLPTHVTRAFAALTTLTHSNAKRSTQLSSLSKLLLSPEREWSFT